MTRTLTAHKAVAKSGKTDSLVILLHGYGADGNDLLGLSEPLSPYLPDTVFVAPDAPNPCSGNPMGFEWFPIPWLDGSSEEAARVGMLQSLDDINQFIDQTMRDEGVAADKTILIGFSQGTMMSLHLAPRRAEPLAGVVGFSGRLLDPESLKAEVVSRPPILLIHGDQDDMVPPASLPEAANALTLAEFEVFTHISKGTAHGIAQDGMGMALEFMLRKLGLKS
jgi:phospholipase/carboxylesterase